MGFKIYKYMLSLWLFRENVFTSRLHRVIGEGAELDVSIVISNQVRISISRSLTLCFHDSLFLFLMIGGVPQWIETKSIKKYLNRLKILKNTQADKVKYGKSSNS